ADPGVVRIQVRAAEHGQFAAAQVAYADVVLDVPGGPGTAQHGRAPVAGDGTQGGRCGVQGGAVAHVEVGIGRVPQVQMPGSCPGRLQAQCVPIDVGPAVGGGRHTVVPAGRVIP